ncbi:MAG: oligosaccharide flippase family protein [Planctomycetes bacterium]|nr:oligosaccharide flippase family protein [Planctomycetota bacterium]
MGASVRRTVGRAGLVFGGNLASTALGFLANILIMRSLGAGGFGVVVVTTTVLNVLWQLTGRGIDQAMVRCLALYGPQDPRRAEAARATVHQIKLIAGALVCLAGVGLAWPLTRFFIGPEASPAPMVIAVVSSLAASIWGYTGAYLQATNRFRGYTFVLVANAGVRFVVIAMLWVSQRMTISTAIGSLGVGYAAGAAIGYAMCPAGARGWRGSAEVRPVIYSLSRWLVISSVINLLYSRLDQLMLSRMLGPGPTGVYGAAATFVQLVDLLTASVMTVLLPRVCTQTDPGPLRRQAWASLRTSALLVVPMLSGFVLAEPVIGRLLGPSFGQTAVIFKIILAGALFNVLTHPLQVIMHARGRTNRLLWLDVVLLLLSVPTNLVAISGYGVMGAAFAAVFLRVGAGAMLVALVALELRAVDPVPRPVGGPPQPPRL